MRADMDPGPPLGHSAWARPYRSLARFVMGSSAIEPISFSELCAFAGRHPAEVFAPGLSFDYGPVGGSLDLRTAIGAQFPGLIVDNIAVTTGAGEALNTLASLVCRPEAHVIVQLPAHESLLAAVERSGCNATFVRPPTAIEEIVNEIRAETVAAFVTSPHNPTGQILTEAMLRILTTALATVDAVLVVDEVYRGLSIGAVSPPASAATVAPNAVSVGGLSKAYGLPGLRLGWVAGPALLVDDVRSAHRYMSRCPPVTSEVIAILALSCRDALLRRAQSLVRDAFVELSALCNRCEGVRLSVPDGGTVAFPELDVPDVDVWCAHLVERYGVLVAPGQACFGIAGRIRINLGVAPAVREAAFPLLARALAESPHPAWTSPS